MNNQIPPANNINIVPAPVAAQVERKRSLHEEMGSRGLLVKQCSNECQQADYAAGPLPAQRVQSHLPAPGFVQQGPLPAQGVQNFQVAGQLPQGLPNVGVSPVPTDPFIQKAQGIRPGEGLLYDARGLPLDAQGYLPNTGPTIGQRMRDAAHIGEPNGQPNYVDVHSTSSFNTVETGAPLPPAHAPLRQEVQHVKEHIRDQAPLPPQQLPPQPLPAQQLPPQQFVQQPAGFIQQPGFVAQQPIVPVKGVGVIDKAYMGIHNLKEHVKDKIHAHQETKELKHMAEAEMKAERKALEAQQYPIQAQLEAERKGLIQQQEVVVSGLKSELSAERAAFEQKQAQIQAQLDAERRQFLQGQEAALGGLKSKFDAQRDVIEGQQAIVKDQLHLERQVLRDQQDAAAEGLKAQLDAQKKAIQAAGLQQRAVENQMFVNQVIAEHTQDALEKEARLALKGERKVLEQNLAEQTALEKAALKEQAALNKAAIQQQAASYIQEGQQFIQQPGQFVQQGQQFVQQGQQQFVQQPAQFIQQAPAIIEKEVQVIRSQALPAETAVGMGNRLQGTGQQIQSHIGNWANEAVNNTNNLVNQATFGTNNVERRVENAVAGGINQATHGHLGTGSGLINQQGGAYVDQYGNTVQRAGYGPEVKNFAGGQQVRQGVQETVRDPAGNLIADAKNMTKDVVHTGKGETAIKHEEKTKVNERV